MSSFTTPGPDAAVYVISVAAELSGLHPQTLRAYERMGLITPGRTPGGGRRYSLRDIERLRSIAELTAAGVGVEGVRRLLDLENQVAALQARNAELTAELEAVRAALRQAMARRPDVNKLPVLRTGAPDAVARRVAPGALTMPILDRITRDVGAAPDAVYAAFLDADALVEWLPPEGMTGELADADLTEGGGFTMTLTYDAAPEGGGKTTPDSDVTHVEIAELEQDRKVVWSVGFDSDDPDYEGRMTMTWSFAPTDDGTRVAVDVTDVPRGIDPEVHAQGIRASLANLAGHLEG